MGGTFDYILELVSKIESQGFKYHIMILDSNKYEENDKINIYTNLDKKEINKVIKAIDNKNKDKK